MSYESNVNIPSNEIEIEETLKGQARGIICCDICSVIIFAIVSIAIISGVGLNVITVLLVIFVWGAVGGIFLFSYRYIKGSGKIRRFIATNDYISIEIPDRPPYRVNLRDFNSIEVVRRTIGYKYTKKSYYNFIFSGANYSSEYEIESQKDFSRKAIKKFREQLEEFSAKRGRQYSFRKW